MMFLSLKAQDSWSVERHMSYIYNWHLRDGRCTLYLVFMQNALMVEKRSMCHDHRAVNNVNKHSGHLESTGISAMACIHGVSVPNSVVDFQKGEL